MPDSVLVYGGGEFCHTLMQHNLIDEYQLIVFPVVVGAGLRLFTNDADATLTFVGANELSLGVVALTYRQADRAT